MTGKKIRGKRQLAEVNKHLQVIMQYNLSGLCVKVCIFEEVPSFWQTDLMKWWCLRQWLMKHTVNTSYKNVNVWTNLNWVAKHVCKLMQVVRKLWKSYFNAALYKWQYQSKPHWKQLVFTCIYLSLGSCFETIKKFSDLNASQGHLN